MDSFRTAEAERNSPLSRRSVWQESCDEFTCYPGIGSYEPLLVERPEGFRSVVVHRNCKLVYYVDGDTLYIADLWDTRREPRAQAGDVK